MIEVGVISQFQAAHTLRGDFGPATRRHGHTYRVEAQVRGTQLRPDGTLLDIVVLQEAVQAVVGALDFQDLDEVPVLSGRNTTVETVAQHFFEAIAPRLRGQGLSTLAVRVWESPQAYAAVDGGLE